MRRVAYLLGDAAANSLSGAIVGAVAGLIFTPDWPGWLAMGVGMAGGMVVAMPLAVVSGIALGAFEVMLPMMLGGMLAGMAIAMDPTPPAEAAMTGATAGLAALGFSYVMDGFLGGEAHG